MTINEVRLKTFLQQNNAKVQEVFVIFTDLFNKIGKEFDDEPLQLALTGVFLHGFLKTINCDKEQKRKLLKNLEEKL